MEEGDAIYCCALRKQGNPWGVSANISWGFANVISDFGFENKVAPKTPSPAAQAAGAVVSGLCSGFLCWGG